MSQATESENERQYRVLDQMLTAHCVLRDRYGRRALLLNVGLLCCAVAFNAFVFIGDDVLKIIFGGDPGCVRVGLGIASVAALILSIVELRVDWARESRSHADAAGRLGKLKAQYREAYSHRGKMDATEQANRQDQLADEYDRTMRELPPVPDGQFVRLKAYHQYKRLLSQEVGSHPAVPVLLLSLRLRWRAFRGLVGGRGEHSDPGSSPDERS